MPDCRYPQGEDHTISPKGESGGNIQSDPPPGVVYSGKQEQVSLARVRQTPSAVNGMM